MPVNDDQPLLIDTQSGLNTLCDKLASATQLYCDTEFVRTQTYWPTLCLVQIAGNGTSGCVDVLADIDTDDFRALVNNRPEPLILHAAKQDLEAWFATWGNLPGSVFDIQVGAGLLGFQPQIGYANLVNEITGVMLNKDQTRTDWSRRPLTQAQIQYATDDVTYLPALYEEITERLKEKDRLDWAIADSAALVDQNLYDTKPEEAWQRLTGIPYLPLPIQARARALACWRESRSKSANRPRQWILSDKALMELAHINPQHEKELDQIGDMPPSVKRKQGKHLLEIIEQSNADLTAGNLELQQKPVPAPPDKAQVRQLSAIVKATGEELGIAPELLATRKDIARILHGKVDGRPLQGWRKAIIGDKLVAAC